MQTEGYFRLAAEQFEQAEEILRASEVQLRKLLVRLQAHSASKRFSGNSTTPLSNDLEYLIGENAKESQPAE